MSRKYLVDPSRTFYHESDNSRIVIPDSDIAVRSEESPLNHVLDALAWVIKVLP
jgi:hypothetical protein